MINDRNDAEQALNGTEMEVLGESLMSLTVAPTEANLREARDALRYLKYHLIKTCDVRRGRVFAEELWFGATELQKRLDRLEKGFEVREVFSDEVGVDFSIVYRGNRMI